MVAFCQSAANLRFSCMVGRRVELRRTGRKEVISSGEIASVQKTSLTQPKRRPIQREPVECSDNFCLDKITETACCVLICLCVLALIYQKKLHQNSVRSLPRTDRY